jgi:hypothetical protein
MTVQPKKGGTGNGGKQKIFPAKIENWLSLDTNIDKTMNAPYKPSLLKTTSEIDSR